MLCELCNGKVHRKKLPKVYFFSGVAAYWRKTVTAVSGNMHVFRSKLETNTRFSSTIAKPIFNVVCLSGNHLGFQRLRLLDEYTVKLRDNLIERGNQSYGP